MIRVLARFFVVIYLVFLAAGVTFSAVPASAATTIRTGEGVSVSEQQTVVGDFYALGNAVTMSGIVKGDFEVVGGNITLNGTVENDLFAIGGTVSIHAEVKGDVRVLGGDVTIANAVSGTVAVMGGRLTILSTATIGGDVLFYGGNGTIAGVINGRVLGNANQLRIDGTILQGMTVTVGQLTLGDQAVITGDVQYISPNELLRSQHATLSGAVVHNDTQSRQASLPAKTFAVIFMVSLFATLCLFLLLKRPLQSFIKLSIERFNVHVIVGLAMVILTPIIVSILLVSVLGIVVGFIGLFLFLLGLVVAIPLMNIVAAALLAKVMQRDFTLNVVWIVIGTLTVESLLFIPWLGPLALLTLLMGTFGSVILIVYNRLR